DRQTVSEITITGQKHLRGRLVRAEPDEIAEICVAETNTEVRRRPSVFICGTNQDFGSAQLIRHYLKVNIRRSGGSDLHQAAVGKWGLHWVLVMVIDR